MRLRIGLLAAFLLFMQTWVSLGQETSPFARWEKEIQGIEKKLRESPPVKSPWVFYGSSTMRLWNLPKDFPGLPCVNCGFGGSQIRDAVHFAPRLLLPLKPGKIVFYSGDNDINAKRTPEQVLEDFQNLVKAVRKELPDTPILFLSIKPSIAREKQRETQKKANQMVEAYCKANPGLSYLDLAVVVLDSEGKHKKELFAKDGLHLSPAGYDALSAQVKPWLKP
ncbi:MAG: hypothetical protein EXR99_05065 [Gemmataceae bacterium]|nr:hypothetical protein [Gemmataceae bacterium]